MERLALMGGQRAVRVTLPALPLLSDTTVSRLHEAVEAARNNWDFLSSISGGGPVSRLESACRHMTGVRYALALSSGSAALFAALLACDVGSGDEVIVPAYTWGQSAAAIQHLGARPVFADVDPLSYTLDPADFSRRITGRTRAVVVVHLFGQMAEMPTICGIARSRGVAVIEDCAQAFGARLDGKAAGSWGHAGCVSFGRGKPVTAGEGGLLLTNRAAVFERTVAVTQHPIRQRFEIPEMRSCRKTEAGHNFRIHPLAAVIACSEIENCEKRRLRRLHFYDELSLALRDLPGIHPPLCVRGCDHAWYRYCPTWARDEVHHGIDRDLFLDALVAEGVPVYSDPISIPLHHRSEFRAKGVVRGTLPVTEERCYRSGIAFTSRLPEHSDAGLVMQIRAAFEKVAAASMELARISRCNKQSRAVRTTFARECAWQEEKG